MSQPATPSSLEASDLPFPRPPTLRSNSAPKVNTTYKLFPKVAEPTPPATPIARRQRSLSNARLSPRSRSVSLDSTVRLAAGQQDAVVKTVPARRGRKVSVEELKKHKSRHMSTVQEVPSPAISIPYSFLPRNSEDTNHARSNSAPGEFVRDSQVPPSAKVDLSKPQWSSKRAEGHPAKGLGLSMPASVSVDRLDGKKASPTTRVRPNLTIEIRNDARMKPKAIGVRGTVLDDRPPPPPPKSPRHDSRNQSLSNISFEPKKVRRTHSRTVSRASTTHSHSSPDSAHPSEGATVASHGNFVKAALVDTPSPSNSTHSKPLMSVPKQDVSSPLSGDVRIKELMELSGEDAKGDLERPVPPPITPGRPRVASLARVMSSPKSVSSERLAVVVKDVESKREVGARREKDATPESKPLEKARPTKQGEAEPQKTEHPSTDKTQDYKRSESAQSSRPEVQQRMASPAVSSTTSKGSKKKTPKPNLDKPMPSLPPPSSRQSEYRREALGLGNLNGENAPPVPSVQESKKSSPVEKDAKTAPSDNPTDKTKDATKPQAKAEAQQVSVSSETAVKEQESVTSSPAEGNTKDEKSRGPEQVVKGSGLSAFPSVPAPPQIHTGHGRTQSPSGRQPPNQRPPPRDVGQREPERSASPAQRPPPNHPPSQRSYSPFPSQSTPKEPGPPRSRFYGRQPESATGSQVTLVEQSKKPEARDSGAARANTASPAPGLWKERPVASARPPLAPAQPLRNEERKASETESKTEKRHQQRVDERKPVAPETKTALLQPQNQGQQRELLQRPQIQANQERALSPTPSARPTSPADLLNKIAPDKSLPRIPRAGVQRSVTPDAAAMLTSDAPLDPAETLRQLTKQSEALHARHASLRADRLAITTSISLALRESKAGPEYANSLLDQHLSLNAINSSLDICFAKLKSLDCKKEAAIQALVEQTKERQMDAQRHRSGSVSMHSKKSSISSHASKASTPEVGFGHLPALQERQETTAVKVNGNEVERGGCDSPILKGVTKKDLTVKADSDCGSLTDGLPTPRPIPQANDAAASDAKTDGKPAETKATSPEQKRNTMVKVPSVSTTPSVAKESVKMSPVTPIDDTDKGSVVPPKRITVKGAKAAKILGLVTGRSESPPGITLPDVSPASSRGSPQKEVAVELKMIQRKPLPTPPPQHAAPLPPTQPGRKMTNESSSTVQTDSSPESEVGTPRGSEEEMVPKSLNIGRKQPPQQQQQQQRRHEQQTVQVYLHDDDILDYYSR